MNTLRELAEAAVKASGADGWQITGGTAHAWAVTLYFNRDTKGVMSDVRIPHVPDGGGPAVVVTQVAADARGDTEVAPARRMWKRWMDNLSERLFSDNVPDSFPVTILPGHDAIERIEREAYERGFRDGDKTGYEEGRRHGMITVVEAGPCCAIDGVSPVVVDGWTHDNYADKTMCGPPYPWTREIGSNRRVVSAWMKRDGSCNTPCRVHLYPGVGADGKRVTPAEGGE